MSYARRLPVLAAIALAVAGPAALAPAAANDGPAAPAPAQVGPFMVFFDAKSKTLTPQGRAILDNAASAILSSNEKQVMLAGHTDTAEPDHVALSQQRAVAVRQYLVSRGIPEAMITTEAFGNTRLLVETGAGVSEPQNRRVEITAGPGSGW